MGFIPDGCLSPWNMILLKPCSHLLRKRAVTGIVDGKTFSYVRIRSELGNRRKALSEAPAAMGTERDDLPAGIVAGV